MREATGNLWDLVGPRDGLVITTNGDVNKDGRAVMGRGIALEARAKFKGIDRMLAAQIARYGNHVWSLARSQAVDYTLFFFPVKHHWYDEADPELIIRSAYEIVDLVERERRMVPNEMETVWMPRPGCGNGRLDWADVKPMLEPILDDRFVAVTHA
jgi:hypothetical protein